MNESSQTEQITQYDSAEHVALGLRTTLVGTVVNIVLIGLKLWGGIVGRSQALIADAVDSIADLIGNAIVIIGLKWGRKPADDDHHYGHARIETTAGMIVGFLVIVAAASIGYSAVDSIMTGEMRRPTLLAVIIAASSILIKETLYWYTVLAGRRIRSQALIATAWNYRSDALSALAVLIGVGAAYINPEWQIADPIAALLVGLLILRTGVKFTWSAFKEVVDTAPDRKVLEEISDLAAGVDGVREVHDLMARLSGPLIFVDIHVVVNPSLTVREGHIVAKRVESTLRNSIPDIARVTIHIDPDLKADH